MPRGSVVLPLCVLLLLVPGAVAMEVEISGLAESGPELEPGRSETFQFNVVLRSTPEERVVCPQDSAISVDLVATNVDASAGLEAVVDPAQLQFTIGQGAYLPGATSAWASDPKTAVLTVTIGSAVPPGHDTHDFGVVASYHGNVPANCQGDFGSAEDSANVTVGIRFHNATDSPAAGTSTSNAPPSPTRTSKDSPAPALMLGLVAAVALLLGRRR